MKHSIFSASAADRWINCPGSVAMCAGAPRTSSKAAATGTVWHQLCEEALEGVASAPEGTVVPCDGFNIEITDVMLSTAQDYADFIRRSTFDGVINSEALINYSHVLEVHPDDAFGTSDAVVIEPGYVAIHDFKSGYQPVPAEGNKQLMLYGLGLMRPGDAVELFIHQPKVADAPDRHLVDQNALGEFAAQAREAASAALAAMAVGEGSRGAAWEKAYLTAGPDQCQWCPAKAKCPALSKATQETVLGFSVATPDEFLDVAEVIPSLDKHLAQIDGEWLSAKMQAVDMIEGWIKAVRAEVERRLAVGTPVPGFKLVAGRKGARQWRDPAEAEEMLKRFKLKHDDMYDTVLISPTSAEKLAKDGTITKRQWVKAEAGITQREGAKTVAPQSDKRPAVPLAVSADDFI